MSREDQTGEPEVGAQVEDCVRAAALEHWLSDRVAVTGPLDVQLIAEGHSNLTYQITARDQQRFVLRRPPRGRLASTAHDMGRESAIIDALQPTGVPVPRVIGYDEDPEISDAPFFVMEYVAGSTISDRSVAAAMRTQAKRRIGPEMAATLAKLHSLDPSSLGLGHLLRDEGLIERQLRRWHRQLRGYARANDGPNRARLRSPVRQYSDSAADIFGSRRFQDREPSYSR